MALDDLRRRVARARTGLCRILKAALSARSGKLLFAFIMLWAYFSFLAVADYLVRQRARRDQLLPFAAIRRAGDAVAILILIFHFFVPFFLLLSQDLKRNLQLLPKIAAWMIFMRLVDLFWLTRPEFTPSALAFPDRIDIPSHRAADCITGNLAGFFRLESETSRSCLWASRISLRRLQVMSTELHKHGAGEPLDREPRHDTVAYEPRDVQVKTIYWYLVFLAVATILAFGVSVIILRVTTRMAVDSDAPMPPMRKEMTERSPWSRLSAGAAAARRAGHRTTASRICATSCAKTKRPTHNCAGSIRLRASRRFRLATR